MDCKRKLTTLVADYSSDDSANETSQVAQQSVARINFRKETAAVERPKRPKFTHAPLQAQAPPISAPIAQAPLTTVCSSSAKTALPADFFDSPKARPSGKAVPISTDQTAHSATLEPSPIPPNSQQSPSLSRGTARTTGSQRLTHDLIAEQRRIQEAEVQYTNQMREEQTEWLERRTREESDQHYYRERIQTLKQTRHRHAPQESLSDMVVDAPDNELARKAIRHLNQLASSATALLPDNSRASDSDEADSDDFAEFLDWRQQSL
ncbi:hypothetical protein H4R34_003207 [Dimargaris verticillata]|uniref:Uncharacterized protein n=1 Tax=Dimargaris verticillata TaxID=2761393 RepID=A0A9W8EC79_9FUNG|nr:hypothetical protein H4R34_003207 [Dimargaris verticillata]